MVCSIVYVPSLLIFLLYQLANKTIFRPDKTFESLNFGQFIAHCCEDSRLLPLIRLFDNKEVDSIWLLNDSELTFNQEKSLIHYRDLVHLNLGYLQSEMRPADFFALINASIASKQIPLLKDSEYSNLPLNIFRHPKEFWTKHTSLKYLDCTLILQLYWKLAAVEYALEELKKFKDMLPQNKKVYIATLNSQAIQLKSQIALLNATDFSGNNKMVYKTLLAGIIFISAVIIIGVAAILLSYKSPILSLIFMLVVGLALMMGVENLHYIEKSLSKLLQNYREQRNATTVAKFIEKHSEIFKEKPQAEETLELGEHSIQNMEVKKFT